MFGAIACVVMIPGQAEFLGTLYAFGAMLSFTIAHVSLIGLRWRLARSRMRKLPGDVEVEPGGGVVPGAVQRPLAWAWTCRCSP